MKKVFALLLSLIFIFQFSGCKTVPEQSGTTSESSPQESAKPSETVKESQQSRTETTEFGIIHELEFGGVYIKITIDDFNKQYDFSYGDSVDVIFSNGVEYTDIPYYSGYYTKPGENLLVAYPGYDYIKLACHSGADLFVTSGLSESDTCRIRLHQAKKYLDNQNARNISYKDDRTLYPGDAVFANFRSTNTGKLKKNILYRSASPCDNQHNRAKYSSDLSRKAGIRYILDLADTKDKVQGYMSKSDFSSDYYKKLYDKGNVGLLGLSTDYGSDDFKHKLAAGLIVMLNKNGPYLVHCTEGKDRTGFVILLFEMLADASYDEMAEDYMMSYFNYYGIAQFTDPDRYRLIKKNVFDELLKTIMNVDDSFDIKNADYRSYAEAYLRSAGMTDKQIQTLRKKLTK